MNVTATMEAVTSLAPTGRGLSHAAVAVATRWILMGVHAMVWFSVSSRSKKSGASFLYCVQICFPRCLPGSGENICMVIDFCTIYIVNQRHHLWFIYGKYSTAQISVNHSCAGFK